MKKLIMQITWNKWNYSTQVKHASTAAVTAASKLYENQGQQSWDSKLVFFYLQTGKTTDSKI